MKRIWTIWCVLMCMLLVLTGCVRLQNDAAASKNEDKPAGNLSAMQQEQEKDEMQEESTPPLTVIPLPVTVDAAALDNCTVAVSFDKEDIAVDEAGVVRLTAVIYVYDLYDMVDIAAMDVGDAIVIGGETLEITELERTETGFVKINGGLDVGGHELWTNENGVYFEIGYSDVKSWYSIGEVTLPFADDFLCTDTADLDKGEVTFGVEELLAGVGEPFGFTPYNTTVTIENGVIVSMDRVYTP